jgi:hypothetical protein|uniref:Tail protein n=1 Tax=Siphoviridae sp. ctu3K14 TaxID=2826500 RepID=A0A8S5N9S7_9CAUD|nr:MAG TPA: tail protein [Siphoviridae sp. ctu3K14]
MALDIKGDSFAGRYKRVNDYPIDTTDIWDTYNHALVYARNTDSVAYVPYAGQIVSVVEDGAIYKLEKDDSISEADGKKHFKLVLIGSKNDNDDRYLRRDVAETVQKLMTFLEGINVKGTATLEEITLLKNIVSKNFAAGGSGFGIYQDADGNYHLDIDFVDIRKKLNVEEIQVQRSTYIGGKQYNTAAGIICKKVEDIGGSYRCYFSTTDAEGRTVRNTFAVGDLAISETFALKTGTTFYWRYVSGCGDDYIDLSKKDCASGSDVPAVGDNIVQLGNRTDTSRQGAIVWDSVTAGGPYVRIYNGIGADGTYTMPEPLIDFNTVLSEITAKFVNQATGKDIDETIEDLKTDVDLVKEQTDREYTLWFFDYAPTLNNIPASEWTTEALKTMHDQDMFYNRLTGKGYRFEAGVWNEITDHLTLKALEDAAKAQDTADGKRRVFVEQPTDSQEYDVGDLWVNATYSDGTVKYKNDSLVCKTAKKAGVAFSISHWEPSSTATTAYLENLSDQIILAVTNSNDGIDAAKELARQGISDAYDAAQDALKALGIAQGAQNAADKNTAAIQVTESSIAALVEGIHFNSAGNITNINTSGLITTADFSALYGKEIVYDKDGHVDMTKMSGIITEAGLTGMFSQLADTNGYVKKSYIDLFVTELPEGGFQSNAIISADNINFEGSSFKVGAKNISLEGYITDNKGFSIENGYMVAKGGTFSGFLKIPFQTFKEGAFRNAAGEYTVSDYFNLEAKGEQLDTYLILNLPTDEKYIGTVLTVYDNPIKTRSSPVVEIKGNMYHPLNVDIYGLKTTTTIETGKGGVIQFLGVNRHDGCVWYVISDSLGESTRT